MMRKMGGEDGMIQIVVIVCFAASTSSTGVSPLLPQFGLLSHSLSLSLPKSSGPQLRANSNSDDAGALDDESPSIGFVAAQSLSGDVIDGRGNNNQMGFASSVWIRRLTAITQTSSRNCPQMGTYSNPYEVVYPFGPLARCC